MADEWDIDLSAVDGLRYWYKKKPKLMQKASALLLNRFAWGTRDEAVRQISALMTVRNPKFVNSRLRVTQTAQSRPISQQRTIAGSVAIKGHTKRGNFTGWTEQEFGTPVSRNRISTLAARKGNIQNQMQPRSRLKRANEVTTLAESALKPRGGTTNYGGWIAMLARQGYKGLVRIKGGLYLIGKGGGRLAGPTMPGRGGARKKLTMDAHLQLVQQFKVAQPKQKHWMKQARANYFHKNPPQRTWSGIVHKLMTPPPKR